jgi:hypothetical protein
MGDAGPTQAAEEAQRDGEETGEDDVAADIAEEAAEGLWGMAIEVEAEDKEAGGGEGSEAPKEVGGILSDLRPGGAEEGDGEADG